MDMYRIFNEGQINVLKDIKRACKEKKIKAYIIGGAVRDSILNVKSKDIDVCVEGDPLIIIKELKSLKDYVYYEKFQTSTIYFNNGVSVDLIRCRKETYLKDGMLPIVEPSSIKDDIYRRDFTVNALAYDIVDERIIDFYGGIDDINNKVIKSIHKNSYSEDCTRIFRAIKYSIRYGFEIEDDFVFNSLIGNNIFNTISFERYIKELYLICGEDKWIQMLKKCCMYGIIDLDCDMLGDSIQFSEQNINFLNMVYCSRDKILNRALVENSFLKKELLNPIRKFIVGRKELEHKLLNSKRNYDIYKVFNGMTKYELVLFSWNKELKYKVYNYTKNILNFKTVISGKEIKNLIERDGKIVGLIKEGILKRNVNMLMNFDYSTKNMGEILYDIEHKYR
ncbi:poly(A) polymerase/tRNA nucleotidyltransferase (CCA-adding enzyme) [Clostridium acetobutylicum]|uniref:tRNA nucleotidyltransferase family enzyme n=2 Tax=Clostridiaceae TaxID=31979 RepID=Q97HE9_CLOAB|nr:TRNA nucleotidyltransferase family enzyme [Clostridium acetobutylicum ATCC 824]ADZ21113.1 TRNA nucleotidyltransferase family enzyme [Clostridium acetobutylicum EA 2018]AEI33466.1 tRNA nucleotidyltransferase family protein [Clostridium acetobutylicum DSM 1731]AWV79550.1 CCA tRNA nucleotidyltransferase [Clostridium acetobutylicum]PSM07510.1 CCA tRNA nucleotidyltransferase [Clostridium sp. NJ4]